MTDLASLDLDQLHELRGRVGGTTLEQVNALIEEKAATLSEKDIQRRIARRLEKLGAAVYWLSQPRATKQTKGVPDLLVVDPYRGAFWVEVKAADGSQRPEQRLFQERIEAAGGKYILGGLAEVEAFLRGPSTPAPE